MADDVKQLPAQVNWDSELKGAAMLIKSGLVPKDIRTAEAALFVVLAGRDLGLSPVQSLRSIRPIQGKIECSADLQLGLFHRNGGKSRWLKLDKDGAELELTASWLTSPHVSKFGIEEAKRAELMSNANYRKYPQAMFRSRAITAGLKDIGFLIGAGVYAPGELGGTVTVDAETGEVLPGDTGEPVKNLTDGSGLVGTVEALPDDERDDLANRAQTISEAVHNSNMEDALNQYQALDTDQKVALWAMLDKDVRKAIKEAGKAVQEVTTAHTYATMELPNTSQWGRKPTISEVSALIQAGKLDDAEALAAGIADVASRTVVMAQIRAKRREAA